MFRGKGKNLAALMLIGFFAVPEICAVELSFKEICKGLAANRFLRGSYELSSTMKTAAKMNGSGVFTLSHDDGIIWFQTNPKPVTIVINDKFMKTIMNGRQNVVDFSKNKMSQMIANMTQCIFAGNFELIDLYYEVENITMLETESGTQKWSCDLVPKDKNVKKGVKKVHLEGIYNLSTKLNIITEYKTYIPIGEDQYSVYQFTNIKTISELTDEEKQLFIK